MPTRHYVRTRLARQSVLLKLARAYHDATATFEQVSGLSAARWRLLFLADQLGDCSQRDLIAMVRVDPGPVTRTLKSLEQDGLIARRVDPDDARCVRVALTPAGRALVARTMVLRETFLQRMVAGADPADVDAFLRVLDRISTNLGDDVDPG